MTQSASAPPVVYVRQVVINTLIYSDDARIRWLYALASAVWCVDLLVRPETLDRPYYAVMAAIAPSAVWAAVFGLYAVAAFWRLFDRHSRPHAASLINGYGLVVWTAATAAQNVSGRFALTTTMEIIGCVLLATSFVCTGWSAPRKREQLRP